MNLRVRELVFAWEIACPCVCEDKQLRERERVSVCVWKKNDNLF